MEKVKKAALSVLAALAIICLTVGFMFSLPTATAYADGTGSNVSTDSETAAEDGVVVVMDGVGYASLEEAVAEGCKVIIEREGEAISEGFANINNNKFVDTAFIAALEAAEEGDVLRLVDDYKGVLSIDTLDRSITVDLNGHNWSASSGTAVVYVTTSADFTLINSGKEGGINANISAINIKAASGADVDVTIENVNVSSSRIASTLISLTGTDGTMRINLNGLDVEYTVTNENQATALSVTDADLTMTDSNISIAYGSETPGSATTTAIDLNHANAELTRVTATSEDGAGIVFTGSMSFDEAVAASVSEYAHLTLNGCTVSGSTIALSGNGGKNLSGTLIDVQNSTLTSTGNAGLAIYHPQYGVLNILGKGNTLTGVTGIEIRAGELNVEGGTITATGAFASKPNDNGSTTDGVAIAVTQHTTALPIDVKISGGTLNATGAEGKSLYQANVQENDPTDVAKIEMQVTGGTFNAAVESENVTEFISGGTFGETLFGDYIADGSLQCPAEGGYIVGDPEVIAEEQQKDLYVAGGVAYESLAAAVAAVPADNNQVTITLVDGNGDGKLNGDGVVVQANQNIVIDFNGNTYDVDGKTVGSSGTETNGFQLLKGATVEMKNGTVTATASTAKLLIQKYCDLTLRGMVVDGTKLVGPAANYVISNNNGTTTFTGSTKVLAGEGDYAFDVYYWPKGGYSSVSVVFDENFTGTIDGNIQYATDGSAGWFENASLTIDGSGTFNGELDVDASGETALEANITISGGTFAEKIPSSYLAEGSLFYTDEGGNFVCATAEDAEEQGVVITVDGYGYASLEAAAEAGAVAYIDKAEGIDAGYASVEEALDAAAEGDTIKLIADVTTTATLQITKKITLDMNGYDITGGSTGNNFVLKIAAGGAKVTNSSADESVIKTGAVEIGGIAVAEKLTEAVTIENITITVEGEHAGANNTPAIQMQSDTIIDNVHMQVNTNAGIAIGILAAGGEADIRNSVLEANQTGAEGEAHVIHAQSGSDVILTDSEITSNDAGIVFLGSYSKGDDAIAVGSATFASLTVSGSTITTDGFAVTGNGTAHGTLIEIRGSTLTSNMAQAIYHPQYGEMTVSASTITGTSGIEVRAGIVTIESSIITATGDPFVSDPNGNGSTTDGAAISLVQHTTKLPTQITVKSGTFTGVRAFYQANLQNNDEDALAKISAELQGGTYEGEVVSENMTGYITGGRYSQLPAEDAFVNGYQGELYNGYYVVVGNTEDGESVADLLTAQLDAQADVRLYVASLGMSWSSLQGNADAADILTQYAAIENASSVSAVALAKTAAMDAVDAYLTAIENARAAAIEEVQQAATANGVTVPTATYAAINGALSQAEVTMYKENALAEIEAIAALQADVAEQATQLKDIASALEALQGSVSGDGNAFDALLADIEAAIDAAQAEIESGTSESLADLQAALEQKIDAGNAAIESAIAALQADVAEQATQLKDIASALEALQGSVSGDGNAFDALLADIEAAIDAAQAEIESGTGESLADLQAALEQKIDAGNAAVTGALEEAVEALRTEVSSCAAKVDAAKADLEAALGAHDSAAQADLDALTAKIDGVQGDIDALAAAIEAEGGNVADLAADIADVQAAVEGITSSVQSAVQGAQDALSQQIEDADDSGAFTVVYVLAGIALALAAVAVVLQVVALFKRNKSDN